MGGSDPMHIRGERIGRRRVEEVALELALQGRHRRFQQLLAPVCQFVRVVRIQAQASRWDGELLDASDDQLYARSAVEQASKRDVAPGAEVQIGCDVAHMGGDEIVAYRREGLAVVDQSIERKQPYTATAERIVRLAHGDQSARVVLDAGGGGIAVAEILRDVHGFVSVFPVYFGGPAYRESRYANRITEIAVSFGELLPYVSIPDDPDLRDQLLSREREYVHNQSLGGEQVRLADKRKAAKKLGRSPDRGDALLLAFARVMALRFPKLKTRW